MKLEYKILWYEDNKEYINPNITKIEKMVKKHKLIPVIKIIQDPLDIDKDIDIDELNRERYDLIIMDYNLGVTTGDKLIESIRKNEIYTDVIFYSGDEKAFKINLEGVFYSSRMPNALFEKIEMLLEKNLKRVLEVSNLRGIVMDITSDFDSKIKDIILKIWDEIDDKQKEKTLGFIKEKLFDKAKKYEINKYDECINNPDLRIMDIFDDEKHIMDSDKRAELLSQMLKISNNKVKAVKEKVSEFEINNNHKKRGFHDRYAQDILKYRNCLAHAKKEYSGNEDIYIGKIDKKPIKFDNNLCEEIRETLIKYEELLDDLYKLLEE